MGGLGRLTPAVLALLTGLATACDRHPTAPALLDEVASRVDTNVTLGAWLAAHPGDSTGSLPPIADNEEGVCRVVSHREPRGSVFFERVAVFALPSAPQDLSFPADTAKLAERMCRLRAIWLFADAPDSLRAAQITDSLSAALESRLGKAAPDVPIRGFGSANWRQKQGWRFDGTSTVIGRAEEEVRVPPDRLVRVWRTQIVAFAPNRGYDQPIPADTSDVSDSDEIRGTRAELDSALAEANLGETQPLRAEIAHREANRARYADSAAFGDSVALPALRALVSASRELPAPRRAAALFAAELIVDLAANGFPMPRPDDPNASARDSTRRLAFQATGAQYEVVETDAENAYIHNWLVDAYHTDSLSWAGRAALRHLLSRGGGAGSRCANGPNQFTAVIPLAESALRAHAADTAMLHRVLAHANADIFSLAQPTRDELQTPLDYSADAPAARRRAFQHALIALGTLRERNARRDMWNVAFRLVAGVPGPTRYYCVND